MNLTNLLNPYNTKSAEGGRERKAANANFTITMSQQPFFCVMFANITATGCQFLLLTLIAKMGTVTDLGMYALAQSITTPIFMFSGFQLRPLLATDASDNFKFSAVWSFRVLSSLISTNFLAIFALVVWGATFKALVLIVFSLRKFLESLSDVFYGFYQKRDQMQDFSISMVIRSVLGLCLFFLSYVVTRNLTLAILVFGIAQIIPIFLYDKHRLGQAIASQRGSFLNMEFRPTEYMRLAKLGVPLGAVMMVISLQAQVPKYLLEGYIGTEAVGIFSALAYFHFAGELLVNSIGQIIAPRLARSYVNQDKKSIIQLWLRLFGGALGVGFLGVVCSIVLGESILKLLFNEEISTHSPLFVLIMISSAFLYIGSSFGYIATAIRKIFFQPLASILSLTATYFLCNYFLSIYGMYGIGYALVISSVISVVLKGMVLLLPRTI